MFDISTPLVVSILTGLITYLISSIIFDSAIQVSIIKFVK